MDNLATPRVKGSLAPLALAALGVVFGDIGTSPLYTLKTVLAVTGDDRSDATVLGILSLLIWTLVVIASIKYVSFAMRADNDGEGGILALMTLLGVKRQHRPVIVAVGLFGAALIYGDGAITPAISVLSALEGLEITAPNLGAFILPLSVVVLVVLFALQPLGTARIGRAFGPIMFVWFVTMALLGLAGILRHPQVLYAVNPYYAARFLVHGGAIGFLILGAVFLCVTGAEALYADMGHFGARPIRFAWSALVFPSLVLNYAGQAALVLEGAPIGQNIFYRLCPPMLLVPLIVLATLATIIASQSIITGAFSMTRQAIQLGWMPRFVITQTSEEGYGQIYVGAVNWLLMLATVGLALAFKKSDNLAAAYGIAVSATMLLTSALLFIAMREIWRWSLWASGAVAGVFFIVDASFFAANSLKFLDGGYVPLALAAIIYALMYIWHRGTDATLAQFAKDPIPITTFFRELESKKVARVPGTAVFLSRSLNDTPPIVAWHVLHNRSLHANVVAITVITESIPYVRAANRLEFREIAPNFWRARGVYGFVERPNIPRLIAQIQAQEPRIDLTDSTYYVGTETIVAREDKKGLLRIEAALFAAMQRNAAHVTDFFQLPSENVVEIGRQISI
jgi:KUP system potassium uptake protein